uniref:Peptidase S1 domain-containing protein n=1 Tax=Steinernema glaseri TaxID=37863 RepID=A0A1I7YHA6_9BILA
MALISPLALLAVVCFSAFVSSGQPIKTTFIAYGDSAEFHAHPWFAHLETYKDEGDGLKSSLCGGTVVGKRWILTAAHCVLPLWHFGKRRRDVNGTASLAKTEHSSFDEDPTVRKYRFKSVVGSNNDFLYGEDIALIETFTPITFDDHVKPINLTRENLKINSLATTTGFGQTEDHAISWELMETTQKILHPAKCRRNEKYFGFHDGSMLCFGGDKPNVCYGDSGGPLLKKDENGVTWQYGIAHKLTSPTHSCTDGTPSIFTRVSAYCDWIEKTTRKEVKCAGKKDPKSRRRNLTLFKACFFNCDASATERTECLIKCNMYV